MCWKSLDDDNFHRMRSGPVRVGRATSARAGGGLAAGGEIYGGAPILRSPFPIVGWESASLVAFVFYDINQMDRMGGGGREKRESGQQHSGRHGRRGEGEGGAG